MPIYSIVIPIYNEEDSIDPLVGEMTGVMNTMGDSYEIIFVNDGSDDRSLALMEHYQKKDNQIFHLIDGKKRKGQTLALRDGLFAARGDLIITMDADLQNDPKDIPAMVDKLKEGYDVVCGWRKGRQDKPLKRFLSKFGNYLQRIISGMRIHDVSCTLRLYRRECIDKLNLGWEGQHRFIPLILKKKGFKIGEIVSHHRNRQFGRSKYNHKRIFKVMADFFRILWGRKA